MREIRVVIAETDEERRNHSNTKAFVTHDGRIVADGKAIIALGVEIIDAAHAARG